ncbi:uncharacterized protein LOC129951058 [Eupeodes corollae]|uniref:uncharacterized protein LOC129951058 n=1 Tax=Eupeodes corollae TaxID=290404 RepID=UPI0024936CA3|nr:uncharacterized protein LOC129951058 [Eupeodes corollae]
MSDWRLQRDEVKKLISAYKKHKCLWDYRSNEYKLHDLKMQAWQKLGKMFGKEGHIVKRKIKCLRSVYGCEKRKVENSYGTNRIYQPNLFYYKDLNFLDSVIINRKGTSHIQTYIPIEDLNETENETQTTCILRDDVSMEDGVSPPLSPLPPQKPSDSESHSKIEKQNRLTQYSNSDAPVNNHAELKKTTKSSVESIYVSFGETIALQLSQLSSLDATITMSEIHQILSRNIIKHMLSTKKQSCANCELVDRKLTVVTSSSEKTRQK